MELFEYLNDNGKKNMKITIGQWLGRRFEEIISAYGLTSDVINNIDRMKLAEKYLADKIGKHTFNDFKGWFKGKRDYDRYELENDIAQFIDLKIPLNYYLCLMELRGERDRTYIKGGYEGIDTLDGVVFVYEENYELENIILEVTKNIYRKI